ncbi:helix-turn-helix domain-containing protein [Streptomyces sp. NPDC059153]|uniref:helix-turn-helix domain-containing protein n=1 Tax=Streptomyces sp. NPDC059153 TaxID=3346743 RepID=UPI0036B89282
MLADPEASVTSIAKLLGISRTTLYKYEPELEAGGGTLSAPRSPPWNWADVRRSGARHAASYRCARPPRHSIQFRSSSPARLRSSTRSPSLPVVDESGSYLTCIAASRRYPQRSGEDREAEHS